ncbi:cbb3-type cytochrome c oxidase subunit I [Sulfurihydrogenibium sp.]|uniref:cbb3-type cytochrome c oxidase subunit I n=1 Tax=Sulfurihydrogenibium sp. TaxID=2053621 RepID=UPI0026118A04|nr:cbb3-type cytochrome c oxidase subunit I [Sulfurihydrogenibium sp.]
MATATTTAGEVQVTNLVNYTLVKLHVAMGLIFFIIVGLMGFLYSLQLDGIYPFPGIEFLSPGRVRMIHTAGAAYGFLVNMFTGLLYWAVPRFTGYKVFDEKYLGGFLFIGLQAAVLITVVAILFLGQADNVEWGETPWWLDPIIVAWLLLHAVQFGTPIIKASQKAPLYVTGWYISAMLVWTPLVVFMGNFIPRFWSAGSGAGAVQSTFIHDLVGLYVTPVAWGLMYYFVPVIMKKPMWSHGLSLLGFWGLAFFYPLNGVHHFLWSPIPMFAQYSAVFATVAIEFAVTSVLINFMMTLRGSAEVLKYNVPLRYMYTGAIFYWITCFQCAFHVTLTFQKVIHFTDWVTGHAHLIMFGTFGMWVLGMAEYVWPRLFGKETMYSKGMSEGAYWLLTIGVIAMFVDLTAAGLVQGFDWIGLNPWIDSVNFSKPFWYFRSVAGIMMLTGLLMYAMNFYKTATAGKGLEAQLRNA